LDLGAGAAFLVAFLVVVFFFAAVVFFAAGFLALAFLADGAFFLGAVCSN